MKLATFNVENMFERPAVMNLPEWSDGKGVLQDFFELNDLIQKASDTTANQNRIRNNLVSEIRRYRDKQRGDRYLFAAWLSHTRDFEFYPHVVGLHALKRSTSRAHLSSPRSR